MPPESNEQQRRELIRQLEHRYEQAKAKRLKAEAESADAQREIAAVDAALARAKLPLPAGDICPNCWFNHGFARQLINVRAVPPRPMEDLFRCVDCTYETWRQA